MSRKHLVWGLMAASLLTPASVSVVRAQAERHASHGLVRGPLPEAVRQATEGFRDVNDAITDFAKPALFDGKIDVEHPEVLVYEPKNGRLHLVAAEYIVPAPAWDPASDPSGNPHVMGHLYHFVPGPNRYGSISFYELHVWAWKDNPHGSFADWNPKASCAEWGGTTF